MELFSTYYEGSKISFKNEVKAKYKVADLVKSGVLNHFIQATNENVLISTNHINYEKNINKYFNQIYLTLKKEDFFIGYFETFSARNKRIKLFSIPILGKIYLFIDFLINRVFPKLFLIRKIYNLLNSNVNRQLSKAEVLGRLVYCGFDIIKVENFKGLCYFKVKKSARPPSKKVVNYGPIYKAKRIGKHGNLIYVYKFRTMHPYSEYLHTYLLNNLGFGQNGKIKDDFRIAPWGKFLRKYWLDELPQICNIIKGEMKLVGIRPVSESYYEMLPGKLKQARLKFKPGCIPPYIAFNKKQNLRNVLLSEVLYMKLKLKNPYMTDIKLLFQALFNILFKGKRSA